MTSRPGWARRYADSHPTLPQEPCRCFFTLERALDGDPGFEIDRRNPDWLGYNEVTLSNVQLAYCPKCGGRCGAWRDEVIAAHDIYRQARLECDFLAGRLDPDLVAAQCAARGARAAQADGIVRVWQDDARHLQISLMYDYDHEAWYGDCTFLPPAALKDRPFRP